MVFVISLMKWAATWENQQYGFWPGLTQTRLYRHWSWLEAGNFVFRKERYCTIQVAKTKVLISFAVTAKLICVFDFAYAKHCFLRMQLKLFWFSYIRKCIASLVPRKPHSLWNFWPSQTQTGLHCQKLYGNKEFWSFNLRNLKIVIYTLSMGQTQKNILIRLHEVMQMDCAFSICIYAKKKQVFSSCGL